MSSSNEYSTIDLSQLNNTSNQIYIDRDDNNNNNNGTIANGTNGGKYTSFHSSSHAASQNFTQKSLNTLDYVKNWSKSTFKCTKQMLCERLGKTNRTVDADLEAKIEYLRDTKRKYEQILNISRAMTNHFSHFINSQKQLSDLFIDLSHKNLELQEDFSSNSELQRNLYKNGEVLLSALNFFVSNLNTLCNKTIEDTIITIRQYETARLEYDAYRCDLEVVQSAAQPNGPSKRASNASALKETQNQYDLHKNRYEKLKEDVVIKMKFLDENRVKVMQKQLNLYHDAIRAYFSGNKAALEQTIKQFSVKSNAPSNQTSPVQELRKSFLEDN